MAGNQSLVNHNTAMGIQYAIIRADANHYWTPSGAVHHFTVEFLVQRTSGSCGQAAVPRNWTSSSYTYSRSIDTTAGQMYNTDSRRRHVVTRTNRPTIGRFDHRVPIAPPPHRVVHLAAVVSIDLEKYTRLGSPSVGQPLDRKNLKSACTRNSTVK